MTRRVQVVMEEALLRTIDRTALRLKVNRSALIRVALRQHLRRLKVRDREDSDRRGYQRFPEKTSDLEPWDSVAAWPED